MPNKIERYTAALRGIIQYLSIKKGINTKYLKKLKKIYIAEAILNHEDEQPINITEYLYELLGCVHIIKTENNKSFFFRIKLNGTYLIKQKLFSALLLSLCEITDDIEITHKKGNIIIKCRAIKTKNCLALIKKLKGSVLCEIKSNNLLFSLPVTLTDKKPIKQEASTEDYILNLFSPINIFINSME